MGIIERQLRSVHVPLSDEEWLALKIEAATSKRTLGEVIAAALQANGSSAPLTEADARAATKGL